MCVGSEAYCGVTPVNNVVVQLDGRPWQFAAENGDKISALWGERQKSHPYYYNGKVHIMTSWKITSQLNSAAFIGTLRRTNFASFLYWRDFAADTQKEVDFSGGAALICTDGALLMTVSSERTILPGVLEFPSGFVDVADFDGDRLNFDRHVEREVEEEVAITRAQLGTPKQYLVSAACRVAQVISIFVVDTTSREFIQKWRRGAGRLQSEISDIVAAYRFSDLVGFPMQEHVKAAASYILNCRQCQF